MLEEKWSYAEEIIKRQRKYDKSGQVNALEPKNRLEDGFLFINYKKRILERKELAEGRVSMIMPKDWRQADIEEEGTFYYYSPYEKEVLQLHILSDWEDMSVLEWTEEENYYYSFYKSGNKYVFHGIFRFHKYRRKTWEKVIPQMIESMVEQKG